MHTTAPITTTSIPTLDTITRSREPENGNYIPPLLGTYGRWVPVTEADASVRGLYRRHGESDATPEPRGTPARMSIGASDRLVLTTHQADALIIFRESRLGWLDPLLTGVQCTLFRNEGHFRCGSLIREAVEDHAFRKWPRQRLFTLVEGRRIVASNSGHCFVRAGWRRCGVTAGGLVVMERTPDTA